MLQKCAALIAAAGLVVTAACAQTDAGITTSVKTKLAADDTVKAYEVNVTTENGVVTLSGDVDSQMAKDEALRIARDTDGVRDVIDQLRVGEAEPTTGADDDFDIDLGRPGDRDEADIDQRDRDRGLDTQAREAGREAGAAFSDASITTTVKTKFLADDTVKGLNIDVDTNNGVVTLTGDVSSRAEAEKAMTLARETDGVKNVIDKMQVQR